MSDASAGSGKKSPLLWIGLGALVVLCAGVPAVLAATGFVVWQVFRAESPAEGGLLTVINQRAEAVVVDCGADGSVTVDAGDTATRSIESRPARCLAKVGDAVVAEWRIEDPPRADETWSFAIVPSAAAVLAAGEGPELALPVDAAPPAEPLGEAPAAEAPAAEAPSAEAPATASGAPSRATATRPATRPAGAAPAAPSSTASSSASSPSASSSGSASASSPAAPAAPAASDLDPLTAVRVEWSKKAKRNRDTSMVMDGGTVGVLPAKALVKTGLHTLGVVVDGKTVLECTVAASGKDVVLYFDPAAPACP